MGRADIGKDIARASLCLHLNNKTLHVRPAVTLARQRALTLPRPRPCLSRSCSLSPVSLRSVSKLLSRYGSAIRLLHSSWHSMGTVVLPHAASLNATVIFENALFTLVQFHRRFLPERTIATVLAKRKQSSGVVTQAQRYRFAFLNVCRVYGARARSRFS